MFEDEDYDDDGYVVVCYAYDKEGEEVYVRYEDEWLTGCPSCGTSCWENR